MRPLLALVLVGCGATASGRTPQAAATEEPTCDLATWRDAATTLRRAYLASIEPARHVRQAPIVATALGGEPLVALEIEGEDVRLATVRDDVIVARWAPITALGRAVVHEIALSAAPGSPGDPGVRLHPGFRLSTTTGTWIPARTTDAIELAGFVPASARGIFWEEPPRDDRHWWRAHARLLVRSEPRIDAPIRAVIRPGARVEVRAGRGDWLEVIVHAPRARIEGFVERPLPPTPPPGESSDGSGLDLPPHSWLPVGACLQDAPSGTIVGIVVGSIPDEPRPASIRGWYEVVVPTGWGKVTYYTDSPLVGPYDQTNTIDFDRTWELVIPGPDLKDTVVH